MTAHRKKTKKQPTDQQLRRQAAAVKVGLTLLRYLPHWTAAVLASILSWFMSIFDARHRRIMERQMHLAFGGIYSPAQLRSLARQCYRHEVLCLIELARLPRVNQDYVQRHIDTSDLEKIRPLKDSGRGVLVITGHIGSWEFLAAAAVHRGFPVTALARPLKNPYLDEELNRIRSLAGNQFRRKQDSLRSISLLLRDGQWVCFLYDQNGGPGDAFVPFFGVPAATWRSAPFLHLRFDCPVVVATLMRENWSGSRFKVNVHQVIDPAESNAQSDPETHVLSRIHDSFEEAIRSHPEQWVWQHRRWKTRPEGEQSTLQDGVPVISK